MHQNLQSWQLRCAANTCFGARSLPETVWSKRKLECSGCDGNGDDEGRGGKRNAVCKDYGRHFIRYILSTRLVMSPLDLGWLGNHRARDNRTKPQLLPRDLVLLYILRVQNLKHSEATFALFFLLLLFLSLSDSFVAVDYRCYQM